MTTEGFGPGEHKFDGPHRVYNDNLRTIFQDAVRNNTLTPATVTPADMQGWIDDLMKGNNPLTGESDPVIKNYVDNHLGNNVKLAPRTIDEAIALGKQWQKDDLLKKIGEASSKLAVAEAGQRADAPEQKGRLQKLLAKAEAVKDHLGLSDSKVFKRALGLLGTGLSVVPIVSGMAAVVGAAENIQEHGVVEGVARSTPVLGDFVTIVVDGGEIIAAIKVINANPNAEDRESQLDQKRKSQRVGQEVTELVRSVAHLTFQPVSPSQTPASVAVNVGGAIRNATLSIGNAILILPGPSGDTRIEVDQNALDQAKVRFLEELRNAGFDESRGPDGPLS